MKGAAQVSCFKKQKISGKAGKVGIASITAS